MRDYQRMLKYGAWLMRYQAVSVTPWVIDQLTDEGLDILNVEYHRENNDPVIRTLMGLLSDQDPDKPPHSKGRWFGESIHVNDLKVESIVDADNYSDQDRDAILKDVIATITLPLLIREKIQLMRSRSDAPWEYLLTHVAEEAKASKYRPKEDLILPHLLDCYNNIRKALVMKGGKLHKVNLMVFPNSHKGDQWVQHQNYNTGGHWVRFPALASRIFIDFLTLGGRDYLGVCKHCDAFFLAERKGRRQFCSDTHRVYYDRKRRDQSAN